MRNPNNDNAGLTPADDAAEGPIRKCILTGDKEARDHLVRLAVSPDGDVLPDVRAKAPGRGAWIGVTKAELAASGKKLHGALARAFKTSQLNIPDDLGGLIETQLQRLTLDRLGLESKAGYVVTGGEKLDKAARSGRLRMLLHASDAGADGAGKLAQAWRVGSDTEGSGLKGLSLPVSRTILSLALGRENVVHAGLTDAKAAKRVSDALNRWLHFIGPEPSPVPCEKLSQGASALPLEASHDDERQTEGL